MASHLCFFSLGRQVTSSMCNWRFHLFPFTGVSPLTCPPYMKWMICFFHCWALPPTHFLHLSYARTPSSSCQEAMAWGHRPSTTHLSTVSTIVVVVAALSILQTAQSSLSRWVFLYVFSKRCTLLCHFSLVDGINSTWFGLPSERSSCIPLGTGLFLSPRPSPKLCWLDGSSGAMECYQAVFSWSF